MTTPSVLFENSDLLILNKPSFWHSVEREGANKNGEEKFPTVENWLRETYPAQKDLKESGLVHRLDLETSGCLLVAKTASSYDDLRLKVQTDEIEKTYWALTTQRPTALAFDLYFSSRYRGSKKMSATAKGKAAERGRCEIKNLPQKEKKKYFLWEVQLWGPGKRHQIRAGFSYLKAPLLGDQLYGGAEWKEGIALHAQSLKIPSSKIKIQSPLPSSWPISV